MGSTLHTDIHGFAITSTRWRLKNNASGHNSLLQRGVAPFSHSPAILEAALILQVCIFLVCAADAASSWSSIRGVELDRRGTFAELTRPTGIVAMHEPYRRWYHSAAAGSFLHETSSIYYLCTDRQECHCRIPKKRECHFSMEHGAAQHFDNAFLLSARYWECREMKSPVAYTAGRARERNTQHTHTHSLVVYQER